MSGRSTALISPTWVGGSIRLFSERIDRTNSRRTRTDNLELQVDTVSHPNLSKSQARGIKSGCHDERRAGWPVAPVRGPHRDVDRSSGETQLTRINGPSKCFPRFRIRLSNSF